MPRYDYRCEECGQTFDRFLSIKEKEETKIECPKCNSNNTTQTFGGTGKDGPLIITPDTSKLSRRHHGLTANMHR